MTYEANTFYHETELWGVF